MQAIRRLQTCHTNSECAYISACYYVLCKPGFGNLLLTRVVVCDLAGTTSHCSPPTSSSHPSFGKRAALLPPYCGLSQNHATTKCGEREFGVNNLAGLVTRGCSREREQLFTPSRKAGAARGEQHALQKIQKVESKLNWTAGDQHTVNGLGQTFVGQIPLFCRLDPARRP